MRSSTPALKTRRLKWTRRTSVSTRKTVTWASCSISVAMEPWQPSGPLPGEEGGPSYGEWLAMHGTDERGDVDPDQAVLAWLWN